VQEQHNIHVEDFGGTVMKVYEIKGTFALDSLTMTERAEPTITDSQVLIRVRAVSLNYRDLLVVKGIYNPHINLPRIPASDGAGEVVAVGKNVTRFKIGDRVAGTFFQTWVDGGMEEDHHKHALGGDIDGMFAELVALDERGVVHIPEHLSYEEAATLPCAGLTAWNALFASGNNVKAGDTVLVLGTGGVSLFALQFARIAGARVIVTSSSDDKLEKAKHLGAFAGINYRSEPEWGKRVRELTGGEGVDHVIEVGGAGTLNQSIAAVRWGGVISLIGVLTGMSAEVNAFSIFYKNARVQGIFVGSRRMFEEMNQAITVNEIKPVVDRVFKYDEAQTALRYMEAGAHFGKIVVNVQ
jgi:NADPH:quinone reductase-like Zn-dependent oxidoreductase